MPCVPLHENSPSNAIGTEGESTGKYDAAWDPKSSGYEEHKAQAGINGFQIFVVKA